MNYQILVNKENKLKSNYVPKNLINIEDLTSPKSDNSYINKLDIIAYKYFKLMQKDAKKEGIEIYIESSYRSYKYQEKLYKRISLEEGEEYAKKYCAKPGYSEHQTGLAIDIIIRKNGILIDDFDETYQEAIWLNKNAHKYGYILRYPKEKEEITGYPYEPWHYRFVGKKIAKRMLTHNICTLEEYLTKYNWYDIFINRQGGY